MTKGDLLSRALDIEGVAFVSEKPVSAEVEPGRVHNGALRSVRVCRDTQVELEGRHIDRLCQTPSPHLKQIPRIEIAEKPDVGEFGVGLVRVYACHAERRLLDLLLRIGFPGTVALSTPVFHC